ncbi:MAG: hypothetical protein Q9N02_08395, partial [Ghiorsea sp.]|nr:hypothetical protein [Ghiorsea sp.]
LHQQRIIRFLYAAMLLYSLAWLVLANDVFGFMCMLVVVLLFKRIPEIKLFFLVMFFMVVFLEILGTHYQCWAWPPIWFDVFTWVPSANPPSGIGVAYFVFDAACLLAYKMLNLKKWQRFRNIQRAKLTNTNP